MESEGKVTIDAILLKMVSKHGFKDVFYKALQQRRKEDPKISCEAVFDELNQQYYDTFGFYRYDGYESFRKRKNEIPKARKESPVMTKNQVAMLCAKIQETPSLIESLTKYELEEMSVFVKTIIENRKDYIFDLFQNVPDYVEMKKNEAAKNGYSEDMLFIYLLNQDYKYKSAATINDIINNKLIDIERKQFRDKNKKEQLKPTMTAPERARVKAFYIGLMYQTNQTDILNCKTTRAMESYVLKNISKEKTGLEDVPAKKVVSCILGHRFEGKRDQRGWAFYDGETKKFKYSEDGWTQMVYRFNDLYQIAFKAYNNNAPT